VPQAEAAVCAGQADKAAGLFTEACLAYERCYSQDAFTDWNQGAGLVPQSLRDGASL
jgi:hypothetical protein